MYILNGVVESSSSLDDRISLSSNELETEDEVEQEETSSQPDDATLNPNHVEATHRHSTSCKKRKGTSVYFIIW